MAGVVTTVGIAGSVFYSALLLEAGLESLVAAGVSTLALFITSLATVL